MSSESSPPRIDDEQQTATWYAHVLKCPRLVSAALAVMLSLASCLWLRH